MIGNRVATIQVSAEMHCVFQSLLLDRRQQTTVIVTGFRPLSDYEQCRAIELTARSMHGWATSKSKPPPLISSAHRNQWSSIAAIRP
jgi:hypothetical protein